MAGTYLGAVLCAGGHVLLEQAPAEHMGKTLWTAKQMGAQLEPVEEGIWVSMQRRPGPVDIETGPYPEFPTDMQSVVMAAAALADGTSCIRENVFENRFCVAKELQKLKNAPAVVLMSSIPGFSLEAWKIQAYGFIEKPYTKQDIMKMVERYRRESENGVDGSF